MKRPEPVDLVEVDAHALPEEQPPALRYDDDGAERGVERLVELVGAVTGAST